ncbi:hypothetical protein SAMN05661093_06497 [Kibdelosporangium aridum]|uniref:Uncharacterized protein n=1 Tax=Kibdelosporangium aridum TaxID=2030 RepID=A0A1Y5XYX1_KIBAR|nr:hypothetical protein SAMN05661093_06497 [Kibdelosporangium aridum]
MKRILSALAAAASIAALVLGTASTATAEERQWPSRRPRSTSARSPPAVPAPPGHSRTTSRSRIPASARCPSEVCSCRRWPGSSSSRSRSRWASSWGRGRCTRSPTPSSPVAYPTRSSPRTSLVPGPSSCCWARQGALVWMSRRFPHTRQVGQVVASPGRVYRKPCRLCSGSADSVCLRHDRSLRPVTPVNHITDIFAAVSYVPLGCFRNGEFRNGEARVANASRASPSSGPPTLPRPALWCSAACPAKPLSRYQRPPDQPRPSRRLGRLCHRLAQRTPVHRRRRAVCQDRAHRAQSVQRARRT